MNVSSSLANIWAAWKRIGRAVGDFIGRLVLTVFYFTIFMPFGLGVRIFRRRPESAASTGNWISRELVKDDLIKAKRLH